MPGIMSDNDIQGHFGELLNFLESDYWREIWDSLGLTVETFETQELARDAPDIVLWQSCQQHQILLVTCNRNQEGPESLETAIRTWNEASSLPVFTLADPVRFMNSRAYADRVVERLLDCLLNLDNYRGAGRVFLP